MAQDQTDFTLVAPFVCGFNCGLGFAIPGPGADEGEVPAAYIPCLQAEDPKRKLSYRVWANGEITFDFFHFDLAPVVTHKLSKPDRISQKDGDLIRIQVANVFRLSLRTVLFNQSSGSSGLEKSILSHSDLEWGWESLPKVPMPQVHLYEIDVIEKSIMLFDKIMSHELEDMFRVVDMCDTASYLISAYRYGESVSSSWTVCERILNHYWDVRLKNFSGSEEQKSKYKKRRERLNDSRSYTSAVKLEVLVSEKVLDHELAESLHSARRTRNDWLHKMASVTETQAIGVNKTAAEFISFLLGDVLHLASNGAGSSAIGMGVRPFKRLHPDPLYPLDIDWSSEPNTSATNVTVGPLGPILSLRLPNSK